MRSLAHHHQRRRTWTDRSRLKVPFIVCSIGDYPEPIRSMVHPAIPHLNTIPHIPTDWKAYTSGVRTVSKRLVTKGTIEVVVRRQVLRIGAICCSSRASSDPRLTKLPPSWSSPAPLLISAVAHASACARHTGHAAPLLLAFQDARQEGHRLWSIGRFANAFDTRTAQATEGGRIQRSSALYYEAQNVSEDGWTVRVSHEQHG